MTLAEVAAAIGVRAPVGASDIAVTSVEFDSRKVRPGALFIALAGEHTDGHLFAEAAAAAGAVAVLGSREVAALPTLTVAESAASEAVTGNPAVDRSGPVLAALSRLAHHVAERLVAAGLTVIGVTGSAGKTSTKDLIRAVLAQAGTVVAPPESFNNELGFPYTVLRADETTDFLVLELSARGIGHIGALTRIARPRIGAVLNVGSAHLGEFGSREAIARAKGELVEALPPADEGGVAVLNGDDALVAGMATRTSAAVVLTGTGPGAAVRAEDIALDAVARASFRLVTPEGDAPVHLAVVGEHQVANALAAAAVGRAAGMDAQAVAAALSQAGPASKWRMAVTDVPGGVTMVNDAYNANPESMRAALAALGHLAPGGAHWAVLGEMAELGSAAPEAHRELGALARRAGIGLLAVGDGARELYDGAIAAGHEGRERAAGPEPLYFEDIDAAVAGLLPLIAPGDAVLVKASRAVGLERFAERLIQALPSVLARRNAAGRHSEERS